MKYHTLALLIDYMSTNKIEFTDKGASTNLSINQIRELIIIEYNIKSKKKRIIIKYFKKLINKLMLEVIKTFED